MFTSCVWGHRPARRCLQWPRCSLKRLQRQSRRRQQPLARWHARLCGAHMLRAALRIAPSERCDACITKKTAGLCLNTDVWLSPDMPAPCLCPAHAISLQTLKYSLACWPCAGSALVGGQTLPTERPPGMAQTGPPSWATSPARPHISTANTQVCPWRPPWRVCSQCLPFECAVQETFLLFQVFSSSRTQHFCREKSNLCICWGAQVTMGGTRRASPLTLRRLRGTARSRSSTHAGRCWARWAASRPSFCRSTATPMCAARLSCATELLLMGQWFKLISTRLAFVHSLPPACMSSALQQSCRLGTLAMVWGVACPAANLK